MEDQGPRRRRSSITLAILQRSHETDSDYILYSEGDFRDFKHAIIGYQNQDIAGPSTSGLFQNIGQINISGNESGEFRTTTGCLRQRIKNSMSMQHIDQVNIIRCRDMVIGPTVIDRNEIITAVQEMNIPGILQNIENLNIVECEGITFASTIQTQRVEPEQRTIEPTNLAELESDTTKPKKRNRIRCLVAVFVCFVAVVGCVIFFQVMVFLGGCGNNIIGPPYVQLRIAHWWYKCRWSWGAELPVNRTYLNLPIKYVVVGHNELYYCDDEDTCKEKVQTMQKIDIIEESRVDIRPNFMIASNGLMFEGRGANVQGAMLSDHNNETITIMFLGDYERNHTCSEQFEHLDILLTELVDEGILAEKYKIFGECQIGEEPLVSPGPNVMKELEKMDHFYRGGTENCVKRENLENQRVDIITDTMYG